MKPRCDLCGGEESALLMRVLSEEYRVEGVEDVCGKCMKTINGKLLENISITNEWINEETKKFIISMKTTPAPPKPVGWLAKLTIKVKGGAA